MKILSRKEYPKIAIVGPPRVGKSSRLDLLEELSRKAIGVWIERGEKYKLREKYEYWLDDGKKKDSKPIRSEEELNNLLNSGKVVIEYRSIDTRHFVTGEDAARTNRYIAYISDSNDGTQAFRRYFGDDLIIFFLYTPPEIIKDRLKKSDLPPNQVQKRISFFKAELAGFLQDSADFHFPMFTLPRAYREMTEEGYEAQKKQEIYADVQRMFSYLKEYRNNYKPDMGVEQFHEAFVNRKLKQLTGSDKADLEARLNDNLPIVMDFAPELKNYQLRIPDTLKEKLHTIKVVKYYNENGRYTISLEGLVDVFRLGDLRPEEILLDLIAQRLGEPTKREKITDAFYHHSKHGLFQVQNAVLRDGLLYSLGDPIPIVPRHLALNIVLLYPNGKSVEFRGDTMEEVSRKYSWLTGAQNPTPQLVNSF